MILLHSTQSKYFKKHIKSPHCVSITVCVPADTATVDSTSVTGGEGGAPPRKRISACGLT